MLVPYYQFNFEGFWKCSLENLTQCYQHRNRRWTISNGMLDILKLVFFIGITETTDTIEFNRQSYRYLITLVFKEA